MEVAVTSESDRLKEAKKKKKKDNFVSPESTITQPESARQTLFVDCSMYMMYELDSLVTCVPINLRHSFLLLWSSSI